MHRISMPVRILKCVVVAAPSFVPRRTGTSMRPMVDHAAEQVVGDRPYVGIWRSMTRWLSCQRD